MMPIEPIVQAARLEAILPELQRRLLALDPEHPTAELPIAQLRLCNLLRDGICGLTTVSRELGITSSAATQLADRLEAQGLVEREADPNDRRSRLLRLTERGTEFMRTRRESRVRSATLALENLTPEERAIVMQGFELLLRAAGGMANGARLAEASLELR